MKKIITLLIVGLLYQMIVLAQEDEVHINYNPSSNYIISDSVSILVIDDESINQPVKILFYPTFHELRSKVSELDTLHRINSVVLLISIKEGGKIKFQDVAFLGEGGNTEIKNSLIQNTSLAVITKGYKLLTDSVPISVKLRIQNMNY